MSSVTEIETEIKKLSVTDQRIIAHHLGERLVHAEFSPGCAAADEGIRFLPRYESCATLRKARGQNPRQRASATR